MVLTAEGMPIPELYADPLADWWTEDHDRALVVGTLKHGFGKYAEIRDDVDLPFAANSLEKSAPSRRKKSVAPGRPKSPTMRTPKETPRLKTSSRKPSSRLASGYTDDS